MTEISQNDLLDVLRKSSDQSYIEPLEEEDDGAGFDVFQAIAAQFARASTAVETDCQGFYLWPHSEQTYPPASGGVQATGNLTFTRDAPADSEITIPEGETILVMLLGLDGNQLVEAELEVTTDTLFASGDSGPVTVPVRATRIGFHGNLQASNGRFLVLRQKTTKTLPGCTTTALNKVTDTGSGDQFDDGDVGCWLRFTAGPNVGLGARYIIAFDESTSAITVDGTALAASPPTSDCEVVDLERLGFHSIIDGALTGGKSAILDMYGKDKSVRRNIGENDNSYRERILRLPDVVSPDALYRASSTILTTLSIPWVLVESRNPSDFNGAYWHGFAYDDPEIYNWILGRDQFFWQGNGFEYRGFYIIVERQYYGDFGFLFDYGSGVGGVGADDAWDHGFYDGYALGFYNDLDNLVSEIERTRMGGIPWLLVLVDQIP